MFKNKSVLATGHTGFKAGIAPGCPAGAAVLNWTIFLANSKYYPFAILAGFAVQ